MSAVSTAITRAFDILEAIAERERGMTTSEVSRRLGIPKSSASYILHTLEQRGYLKRQATTRRYQLSLKILNITRHLLADLDIRELARPTLRELVEQSGLTAHLAVLDQGEAVYIEKIEAPGFVRMNTWIGRRLPVHSTSVGKALVAYLDEATVKALIKERGLRKQTPKTIASCAEFMHELARVREHGFAIDDEENSLGVRCVAAPVFDAAGCVVASIGVTGTTTQNDLRRLPRTATLVKEAARKLSQQLGYRSPRRALGAPH